MGHGPDQNHTLPIPGNAHVQSIKNTVIRSNIVAGDFSYYDSRHGERFEEQVLYHYEFLG